MATPARHYRKYHSLLLDLLDRLRHEMSGSGGGHDRGDLGVSETLGNDDRDGRRHCTRGRAGTSRSVKLGNFNFENFSFFLGHLELYRL